MSWDSNDPRRDSLMPWDLVNQALAEVETIALSGRVVRVGGLIVEGTLPKARLGMLCRLMVPGEPDGGAGASSMPLEIPVPWSTGFETGFCDFSQFGYCYERPGASHAVVSEPVHEGRSAAEFTVTASPAEPQARCVLRGTMPRDAVYGAWYYVPALARNTVCTLKKCLKVLYGSVASSALATATQSLSNFACSVAW